MKLTSENSAQDYAPFGMLLVGRNWVSGSDYRYGFNGKENTDEIYGDDNALDFGARIYDARLGRFLSLDPRQRDYPWQTPYAYYSNNPIANVDINGEGGPVDAAKLAAAAAATASNVSNSAEGNAGNVVGNLNNTSTSGGNSNQSSTGSLGSTSNSLSSTSTSVVNSPTINTTSLSHSDNINLTNIGTDAFSVGLKVSADAIIANNLSKGRLLGTNGTMYTLGTKADGTFAYKANQYFTTNWDGALKTKSVTNLSNASKIAGNVSLVLTAASIMLDANDVANNEMGIGRFTYRTSFNIGGVLTAGIVGAEVGGPAGFVAGLAVGGVGYAGEKTYDNFIKPEIIDPTLSYWGRVDFTKWRPGF